MRREITLGQLKNIVREMERIEATHIDFDIEIYMDGGEIMAMDIDVLKYSPTLNRTAFVETVLEWDRDNDEWTWGATI